MACQQDCEEHRGGFEEHRLGGVGGDVAGRIRRWVPRAPVSYPPDRMFDPRFQTAEILYSSASEWSRSEEGLAVQRDLWEEMVAEWIKAAPEMERTVKA